ncbi:MAG: ComEC/Rec2 family competence protein [Bacteroidota bacterium]
MTKNTFTINSFPLIIFTVSYAIGIILSSYIGFINFNTLAAIASATIIIAFVTLNFIKRKNGLKTIAIIISSLILSFSSNSFRINKPYAITNNSLETEIILQKIYNRSSNFQSCIVKEKNSPKKYITSIPISDSTVYTRGDSFYISAEEIKLSGIDIPNNFNFSDYLRKRGVRSRLLIKNIVKTENDEITPVIISNNVENKIDQSQLSGNSKALLKALVLGRKEDISDQTLKNFSDSGIMHLLALSGLHIGILTWLISIVLKPVTLINKGKIIRGLMVIAFLWIYAYLTGLSSSIVRATIMFSILTIAHALKRQSNVYNSLSIAALILLLINPNNIFDVGFQLSFSAVIGIVWMFPLLNSIWRPKFIILKYFWTLLIVSIAAQIATLPLTLYYFHKFSSLFFVANLIEIPAITFLLVSSYIYILLLSIGVEINLLSIIYDKTVNFIEVVSQNISSLDELIIKNIYPDQFSVFLYFLLIISVLIFIGKKNKVFLFSALLFLITIQLHSIIKKHNNSLKELVMISASPKAEILIQDGNNSFSEKDYEESLFQNYLYFNNIKSSDTILNNTFIFKQKIFWKADDEIGSNPFNHRYATIIDNDTKTNPKIIANKYLDRVIYTGYRNSVNKSRWEYFCIKNKIPFHSAADSLFIYR